MFVRMAKWRFFCCDIILQKKSFNTNNLFKFRITLCNISTALQEHFSTVLNLSCLIPMVSSKNCQNVSTVLQLCGYFRSIAAATTPSLTPWTGQKSGTGLPPVESNLLCSRSGVSEILQRIFKKRGVHAAWFRPQRILRQQLVRPKDEIVAEKNLGSFTSVKQLRNWAQGLNDIKMNTGNQCTPAISSLLCLNTLRTQTTPSTRSVWRSLARKTTWCLYARYARPLTFITCNRKWTVIRATTFPQFMEQFCSPIKTKLRIAANVTTDDGIRMGSESFAKLSTNCWCWGIFFAIAWVRMVLGRELFLIISKWSITYWDLVFKVKLFF